MFSCTGELLRVNLSQGECEVEPIVEQLQRSFLGARGFDIRYFYDELAGKIDPLADEGKGEYIASVQKEQAVRDCILQCVFGDSGLTPELRNQMLVAASGFEEFGEPAYLEKIGERIVTLERAFNVREGFSRKDDTLPSRFLTEPLKNAGVATGQVVRKLDTLLDEYYAAMGYTQQGIPTVKTNRTGEAKGLRYRKGVSGQNGSLELVLLAD